MTFFRLSPSEQLLRLALALAFLYPPVAAVFDPYSWVGYFPTFLSDAIAPHQILLLHAFGVFEVGLALWVLGTRHVRVPALLMAGTLIAIVLANPAQLSVLFRDLALTLVAIAVAVGKRRDSYE